MKRSLIWLMFFQFLIVGILPRPLCFSKENPIATIIRFKGEIIIMSGKDIFKVTEKDQVLFKGDQIQVKQGDLAVLFNDGAIIKMNAFSNIVIEERIEERDFWMFKRKTAIRRVTCFIGKLWFKSGLSKTKNNLQMPTAVCGIRGSSGYFGYNNGISFLDMQSGKAKVNGRVIRGPFDHPGIIAAEKNSVFSAMGSAFNAQKRAIIKKKALDFARSDVAVFQVKKNAADEMKKNPDPLVKKEAAINSALADCQITVAKSKVTVEKLKEAKQKTRITARRAKLAGNMKAVQNAKKAYYEAQKAIVEATVVVKKMESIALIVEKAADANDLETVISVSERVIELATEIKNIEEKAVQTFKDTGIGDQIESEPEPEQELIPESEPTPESESEPEPIQEPEPELELQPDPCETSEFCDFNCDGTISSAESQKCWDEFSISPNS